MPEDLFEEVGEEGETTTLEDLGEKTSTESLTEKKTADVEKKEVITPDDKQPSEKERWRWMQMRKTNRELKERLESLSKEVESVKTSKQEATKVVELPKWWSDNYGNDEKSQQAYRTYQDNTNAEKARIKEEVLNEIRSEQQSEVKGSQEAQAFIDSELEDMKADGLEFETNELMKFIVDFQKEFGPGSLLDAKGNYDLRKSLNLMQRVQPPQEDKSVDIKKKVAGNLIKMKVGSKESTIPSVSRNTLRKGSWRDAT